MEKEPAVCCNAIDKEFELIGIEGRQRVLADGVPEKLSWKELPSALMEGDPVMVGLV